jgi:hypothetical protein
MGSLRKPKSPATALTDNLVDAIGKRWPTTIMNWDTKMVGKFVPWGYVKQALFAIQSRDFERASACLMRPLTSGLIGGPDVTGIIGHAPGATVAPGTYFGIEIKTTDVQSQEQKQCQKNIERHNGIYLLVDNVEQGIADLMKYAGPGELK